MEIQQPSEHEDKYPSAIEPTNPEVQREDGPRIHVASLAPTTTMADFTEPGSRLTSHPKRSNDRIHAMLARSPSVGAEEFAIHDFEGFGPWEQ